MKAEREQLYQLSELMVRNWPADKAGAVGRYHIGQYLIKKPLEAGEAKEAREKKLLEMCGDAGIYQVGLERAREKKFTECVALMRRVKPDFQGYTVAQFQLALAALQIHEDDAQQKKDNPDHKAQTLDGKSYRDVALEALEKIPDLGGDADAELAGFYLRAKVRLGFLYYSDQKYVQMEAMGKKLAGVLDRFKDDQKLAAEEKTFRQQIDSMQLYGVYGKAEADYRAGKYDAVVARLDPVVNELKEGKYPDLKENPRLLAGLMGLALRGNLQSERIDRSLAVLEVWKKLDADEKAVANILQQTVVSLKRQIDDLKRDKNKEKLAKTTESFNAFLNKLAAQSAQHGPDSVRLFAQSYLAIGKNARAAELLAKLPEPRADADQRDVAGWRVSQVLLVRAMRLAALEKTDAKEREEALKKADELMDRIMTGPDKKPGWGQRDVNALKEQILLYVDLGYFGAAVNRANSLKEILLRKINESAAMREHYFEVYYYFVYSYYRYGLAQTDPARKEDALQKSAAYLKKLAGSTRDLGGEESRLRFLAFLESDEAADMRRDPEVVKLIEDLRKQ
jgi:hypothetical protein